MIAFYSATGHFIASVEDEPGGVMVTGDTDFLMQISRGNPTWQYFRTNFMAVDTDDWQSLVLPDGSIPPSNFAEAIMLAIPQPELELERMKFKFKIFSGFGSVGPFLLESVTEEFEAVISSDSRFSTDLDAKSELLMLRRYHQQLAADSDRWYTYLSDLNDEDLALGDHTYFEKPNAPTAILVELGRGLWVQLSKPLYGDELEFVEFHSFNAAGTEAEIADGLARVIESLHAGYVAAIELIVNPRNLDDEYDIYGVDEDDVDGDDNQGDNPIWGYEMYELSEKYCMYLDMFNPELTDALKRQSPQFAELSRMLSNPTPDEYRRLVKAAREFHPGFGGELGMFDEWAGPKVGGELRADRISLYATYELDGELWAEVGAHALISASGDTSTKQYFVDAFSLRQYADLDGKFGLSTSLESRSIVEAELCKYETAMTIAQQIQRLVDQFDAIPEDDVEQRNNFSWNDGETDEMLAILGEEPSRYSTPRYH